MTFALSLQILSAGGGLAGIVALVGFGARAGRYAQRMDQVEQQLTQHATEIMHLRGLDARVTKIDERTKSTDNLAKSIDGKVDRLIERLLDDATDTRRRTRT